MIFLNFIKNLQQFAMETVATIKMIKYLISSTHRDKINTYPKIVRYVSI